ncbi:MAG TPA: TGS domain-containing protein, partial [Bacteroidales bacterium]|nr:TGS domain-containing protein [Bacteroidales bacterium]
MVKLTFPDGTVKEFTEGITGLEIARQISPQLAKEVLSVSVNGELYDLTRPITTDANIKLHKWEDEEGRHAFWHSSAHLMAEAIEQLWPGTKFGIGPAIENGFYYDIDPGDHEITDDDLISIENRMKELASQ